MNSLLLYCKSHGGIMPGEIGEDDQKEWVRSIAPYLIKEGYNPNDALSCSLDGHKKINFVFNTRLSGVSVHKLNKYANENIIEIEGDDPTMNISVAYFISMFKGSK